VKPNLKLVFSRVMELSEFYNMELDTMSSFLTYCYSENEKFYSQIGMLNVESFV
jgi:hypothetical protein